MSITWRIEQASALALPFDDGSVQCCVTSPPYWGLRDYGNGWQLGLEPTPEEYVARMVDVFREVRRVLRDDGVLWLNLGDSYAAGCMTGKQGKNSTSGTNHGQGAGTALPPRKPPAGLKPKDLVGIPWRVAFALQADGWYLRSDCIWHKPNPMPESVTDRPTKAHEYLFLLTKSARYFYDADAVRVAMKWGGSGGLYCAGSDYRAASQKGGAAAPSRRTAASGRNKRTVWTIPTEPYKGAHFAVMPPAVVEPCIKAGTSERGCCAECGAPWVRKEGWAPPCSCNADTVPCAVLDPFNGSGTTGAVAVALGRSYLGTEINADYIELAKVRIAKALADSGRATVANVPDGALVQLGLFG